jgi:hypothetical protein
LENTLPPPPQGENVKEKGRKEKGKGRWWKEKDNKKTEVKG